MNYIKKAISKTGIKSEPLSIIEQNKYLSTLSHNADSYLDEFSLNGYKSWCRCLRLINISNCVLAFYFNNKLYKFHCKFHNISNIDEHIYNLAFQRLKDLIEDKLLYVECLYYESVGILMINLYKDNITTKSINQQLLDEINNI